MTKGIDKMSRKAFLILENGKVFEGKGFGADNDVVGELVFTTSMTGYLGTLTDPNYFGQVVLQTFPLIGNYGVVPAECESDKLGLKAYIVRNTCQEPSNFRCEGVLDIFLRDKGLTGLCDVDTRAITKIVREYGVMNCKITSTLDNLEKDLEELKAYKVTNAVNSVTSENVTEIKAENAKYNVALWDFGVKNSLKNSLTQCGCNVTVFPANTKAEDIIASNPDGVVLSGGPGDPTECTDIVNQIKALCEKKIPTFGIGLGHQLLAMSQGATTEKLKYGHRGANQPSKEIATGRVYITVQNHGYTVVGSSLPANAKETFANANDATCQGIEYTDMPAFSVQFHPTVGGGKLGTGFLFDKFTALMDENK